MKRTIYIVMVALLASAFCLAGCEKERHHGSGTGTSADDGFDYGNVTGKHIVQETAYTTDGDVLKVRYQWNDTRLVRMSILDSMEVVFSYTGDRLSSMRCEFVGYTMDYMLQYTGDKLTAVNTTMAGMEMNYAFEYGSDGNVSAMQTTTAVQGYSWSEYTYYSWSGGNLVRQWDDYATINYQYDNHPTPYALDFPKAMFLAFQTPEMMSVNNINRIDTVGRVSRVINWTYTNDGYPASNGRSDVGYNYYLYADGDGSTGPSGSGDDPNPNPNPNPGGDVTTSLVGTQWINVDNEYLSFVSSNSGYFGLQYDEIPFTYNYSNGSGYIVFENESPILFTVSGNELIIEGIIFTKI